MTAQTQTKSGGGNQADFGRAWKQRRQGALSPLQSMQTHSSAQSGSASQQTHVPAGGERAIQSELDQKRNANPISMPPIMPTSPSSPLGNQESGGMPASSAETTKPSENREKVAPNEEKKTASDLDQKKAAAAPKKGADAKEGSQEGGGDAKKDGFVQAMKLFTRGLFEGAKKLTSTLWLFLVGTLYMVIHFIGRYMFSRPEFDDLAIREWLYCGMALFLWIGIVILIVVLAGLIGGMYSMSWWQQVKFYLGNAAFAWEMYWWMH